MALYEGEVHSVTLNRGEATVRYYPSTVTWETNPNGSGDVEQLTISPNESSFSFRVDDPLGAAAVGTLLQPQFESTVAIGVEPNGRVTKMPRWITTSGYYVVGYHYVTVALSSDHTAFALTGHDHGTAYAAVGHDHGSTYAAAGHDHDTAYAAVGHDHDSTYAAAGHSHDTAYAAVGHDHDTAYAAVGHKHDSAYAAAGHDHDSTYAMATHDHDSVYARRDQFFAMTRNFVVSPGQVVEHTWLFRDLNASAGGLENLLPTTFQNVVSQRVRVVSAYLTLPRVSAARFFHTTSAIVFQNDSAGEIKPGVRVILMDLQSSTPYAVGSNAPQEFSASLVLAYTPPEPSPRPSPPVRPRPGPLPPGPRTPRRSRST